MNKNKNPLDHKEVKKEAEEFLKMIEKLPEDKKHEVFGIVSGYALCVETESKKTA